MARRRYNYFGYYEPARPKKVKGGIKAQSKRGAFASKWWGKRWIQTLESYNIGARLARGRSYARKGQVANLEISKGQVSAQVQGTMSGAYRITINFKTFTPEQWQQIIKKLGEQPIFSAQLLGNEMPEDIETVFDAEKLPLFPKKQRDLETSCSCPDWSNPCKHIAAVFYIMAEAFDRDPFLIFTLRGMTRDEFLQALQASGATREPEADQPDAEPEPLPLEPDIFWGNEAGKYPVLAAPHPVRLHAALPRRLGPLPFWRSDKDFIAEMLLVYEMAGGKGVDLIEEGD
jgi:uncharacterized Zn finger protein